MADSPVLYLIPSGLGSERVEHLLPAHTREIICSLDHFIVERAKTARHFLRAAGYEKNFDETVLLELDKHAKVQSYDELLRPLSEGHSVGVISEAGVPGVADPGGEIVREAHRRGFAVSPLIGPSSILLALMASGMNGQHFEFHGYLSRDEKALGQQLRNLEADSSRLDKTQLFIETPYRNDKLLATLLKVLQPHSSLCIATNITCPQESIQTKPVREWRKGRLQIGKNPTVFALFSGSISGRK